MSSVYITKQNGVRLWNGMKYTFIIIKDISIFYYIWLNFKTLLLLAAFQDILAVDYILRS